jgi:glutamine cyclotransferase
MQSSRRCILSFFLALCSLAVPSSCSGRTGAKQYRIKVLQVLPHDRSAYTQGLFFDNGQLYESTGEYGASSMRKVDLESGKVLQRVDFDRRYFGGRFMCDKRQALHSYMAGTRRFRLRSRDLQAPWNADKHEGGMGTDD